jgi:hypothetical protein
MKGQPGLRVKEIAFVRLRRTAITFFSSLPVGRQAKKVSNPDSYRETQPACISIEKLHFIPFEMRRLRFTTLPNF